MTSTADSSILYGSPDGFERVLAFYDETLDSMGIPYHDIIIKTSFGPTHVVACGKETGKPVLLWHGQNANASTWFRWIPALAEEYRVLAVDTIGGLGKSAPTRLSRNGPDYGVWAAEVVRGLEIQKGNMIGVSNGGWIILKLGSAAPDLTGSAILISSAGFLSVSIKLVFQMVFSALSAKPSEIAESLVKLLSPPDMPADPFYVEFFELVLNGKFHSEPLSPRIRDKELNRFTPPAYILMGEHERSFNPFRAVRRAGNQLPRVIKAEIVPGVGHSMEGKEPNLVIPRIMDFLKNYAV
jgi:pimeloyl-ACP methyl ester carboxylesterase